MSSEVGTGSVLEQVVPHHLCCGCGTCVAACPTGALAMRETPAGYVWAHEAQDASCTGCGLCLRVCPGRQLDDDWLAAAADPYLGPLRACYSGWATDPGTCRNGASGGMVTAIAGALLAKHEVDAVLVTGWDPLNPLRPRAFWARTPEELARAQKSKYCMVPVCEQLAAEDARSLPADARLAVVGLPCQMHGLAKALPLPLAQRISLRIGLFCDRTLSLHVIDRLLAAAKTTPASVSAFEYRHKGLRGWPGDVYVESGNAQPRFVDRSVRMGLKEHFTPLRCRLCFDKFNVLADLSCGDGYGVPSRAEGVSALLVRTDAGEAALASVGDAVHLEPFDQTAFTKAHGLADRKRRVAAYTAAYRALKPQVEPPLPPSCREALPPVDGQEIALSTRNLRAAMEFETAPTKAAAEALIQKRLTTSGWHRFAGRLRRLIARALGSARPR